MIDDICDGHSDAKNRFLHGAVYHMLWDRPLAQVRRQVVDYIPKGSSVIDIACGTGELCFDLASVNRCQIVGLDSSKRMIDFANKRNRCHEVCFVLGDATNLTDFEPNMFDFATIILLLHEVSKRVQIAAINEALRVAKKTIIADSLAPLPVNIYGIALRIVEAMGGLRHYGSFADYLETGGIRGILKSSSMRITINHRAVFWHECREMVVIERQKKERRRSLRSSPSP